MPWDRSRPEVGTTTQRGYGNQHQKARAKSAEQHQPTDLCARCPHPLGPMGSHLHYDHTDVRDGYLGFSHGSPCPVCGTPCNVTAGARVGSQRSHQATPRAWRL